MTGLPDDRDPSGRFVRGLTLGALLGAVIAGSSIWTRARARRRLASRGVVAPARASTTGVTPAEAPPPGTPPPDPTEADR